MGLLTSGPRGHPHASEAETYSWGLLVMACSKLYV